MNRRILLTLLGSVFVALLGVGIIVPILPIYAEDLGATGTTLGLMVAGFSISRGILQPLVGAKSDQYGRKLFLLAGLAVYALAGLLYVTAGSVADLIAIRIFHGVGSAMIVPIAMSYVGDLAPEGEEGRYMGFLNIALFSGIGSGPIIGGVFLDTFGASSAFYAMSSLSAASMLLVLTMLPPDRARGDGMTVALIPTFRRMIRSARVMGILFSRMTSMIVMVPTMAFLPLLMAEFMDASGAQIGLVIATRTLTNAALQTPFGGLVDRHDRVRLLLIGSGVMTAAMAAIPLAGGMPQLLLLFGTLGAGEAIVWPVLGALATEEGRVYGQGSMMGVFNMAMSAGIFLGALGAGWIVDTFSIGGAFVGVAVVVGASAVVSVVLIRREPSPTAPALRAANDARHAARM